MTARCKIQNRLGAILCILLASSLSAVAQDDVANPGEPSSHGAEQHAPADDGERPEDPRLARHRQESFVAWMARSLGLFGLLIPTIALFSFAITLALVLRGNGPFAAAALALIVPIPLYLGLFGAIQGMIMMFQVVAASTVSPKPYELADGIATALFTPLFGLMMMTPSYFIALIGAIIRSLGKAERPTNP